MKSRAWLIVFSLAFVSLFMTLKPSFSTADDVTYAVETRGGVPMITIDGAPVRARFFFGIPGERPIMTTSEYQRFECEFVALDDSAGDGTVHFRFGSELGVIELDNISIADKQTGELLAGPYDFENEDDYANHWETWHEEFQEQRIASVRVEPGAGCDGSKGLRIEVLQDQQTSYPDFHLFHERTLELVKGRTYVMNFDARSSVPRRLRVNFYRPATPKYILLGRCGKDALESQVKLASGAGYRFVSFIAEGVSWPDADGNLDFSALDAACDSILRANPDALLVPRLNVTPNDAWLEANPDARAIWRNFGNDHDRQGWYWPSLNSEKYRETACKTLAAIVRHLEERYGDSIAGYHPCGQNTSEWFTPNTWTEGDAGFADVDVEAFRRWLRAKYDSDAALRDAWRDDAVALENALPPSSQERLTSRNEPYLSYGKLLDFNEFWQTGFTDVIRLLAHVVKQETEGRKLTFFFYGYSWEFSSVVKGPAASGHYALRSLLDCDDVDVICSPISYSERGLGQGCSCMLNAESVTAAGKIYLYEDDSRTYLAHSQGERLSSVATVEESVEIARRNASETSERNFATWLMDLGASGWYDSPEIWDAVAQLAPMDEYFLQNPTPYRPEIALFLSERSMLKVSSGRYTGTAVSQARAAFNRVGAPYAQYDLDDLLSGRAPIPKLTVVLNADALSDDDLRGVETVEKSGQTRVLRLALTRPETDELRKIAREAGVWLYTNRPCNVWCNGPFVTLHAPEDGEYEFVAPAGTSGVVDFITNKRLAEGARCNLSMKKGNTVILQLER